MKAVYVIAIIVAVVGGMYYYTAFLQPQEQVPVTPEKPPLVQSNGHSVTPQGEVIPVEPSEHDLTLPALFHKAEKSVVQITVREEGQSVLGGGDRLGSGFTYDSNGDIITNNHVVEGADNVSVTFLDGSVYKARVVGADPYTDLAVVNADVPKDKLVPLPLGDSSKLEVGQQVAAIGNPFGLSGSMTTGIVSQLGRLLPLSDVQGGFSIPDVIQTDAAINPGNSGGPMLNLRGEVVGVNSAITSGTGEFAGVGFAIPSNTVQKIVPVLIKDGKYRHAWLGVSGTDLTPEIAEALNLKDTKGFLVIDIVADSPADKFGIKGGSKQVTVDGRQIRLGGDVITAVDDHPVRKIDDILVYIQREKSIGDEMVLSIIRDGQPMELTITLAERPNLSESP
ncbi:MAG: S1-C subfamily serine protease [Candidatus Nitrosomirales archaeon]|jgi:S1-C subfamily serine protease